MRVTVYTAMICSVIFSLPSPNTVHLTRLILLAKLIRRVRPR